MYTNTKIRMYLVGVYLLKVNNENSRTSCVCNLFKVNKKRHHIDLIDMIVRNIDVALMSLFLTLKFNQIMPF